MLSGGVARYVYSLEANQAIGSRSVSKKSCKAKRSTCSGGGAKSVFVSDSRLLATGFFSASVRNTLYFPKQLDCRD